MSLPTDEAQLYEQRTASLREAIAGWSMQHPDLEMADAFAYVLNLAFQMAFMMGSSLEVVTKNLHDAVEKAADIYAPMVAGKNKQVN